jgi:hypothetical protein
MFNKNGKEKISSQLLDNFLFALLAFIYSTAQSESKNFCHVHLEDQDHDKKTYFYKRDVKVIEMRTSTKKYFFFSFT